MKTLEETIKKVEEWTLNMLDESALSEEKKDKLKKFINSIT